MMIYTVTLNPSVDYYMDVPSFTIGETNRADTAVFEAGGKGINVSWMLKSLGSETKALGFTAGFTGRFISETLQEANVAHTFLEVAGHTRVNVKLKTGTETEINGTSMAINAADLRRLETELEAIGQGDWLVLSGSLPESVPEDFYHTLAKAARAKGASVVVDTSGAPMTHALSDAVTLMKPNQRELEWLTGEAVDSLDDAVRLGRTLLQKGVRHVLVSLGKDGALLITDKQVLRAEVPPGELRQSVGAGDSMVAGFIHGYSLNQNLEEAFRYAAAAGSATAYAEGLANGEQVKALLEGIRITEWTEEESK
ncbi:1-phosphofructokinase [Salisediminibacterium selenitireducens]|uniref:Tagatose-6-phosphate kinase n=1 Tax=Bacillus selenitireducens (strain ATCC 700615 / DSM 15326 / MLS10) TaxID=439292 RepID=D6Y061_BACIE|nr:1-phosphofructokinase [Salisediminibacterium selenitireducens]ADH98452.1 1-phosphofructokinase [[Bacillus] selenitireducens MLS10]